MKNLSLITALLLLLAACGNSGTDKEKLKEEIKKELQEEMAKEEKAAAEKEETTEKEEATANKANQETQTTATHPERTSPHKVDFDAGMLENLTLYGQKGFIRLNPDQVVSYSLDGSEKRKFPYDAGDPTLTNAASKVSEDEIVIKVHQNFAIGGKISIQKNACKRANQTGFRYSFQMTWENESGLNDSGCAFHSEEEYQIVAKVERMAAGTGGTFFSFTDTNQNDYDFYVDKRGVNLMDHFPELSPMSSENPYQDKSYRIFYKFVEVEDHRSFRAEAIVTHIEEIHT